MTRRGTPTHPIVPAVECTDCGEIVAGQVRIDPRTGLRSGFYIDPHRHDGRACTGVRSTDHIECPPRVAVGVRMMPADN